MSINLQTINSPTSVVWAIGVTRDPSIQFTKLSGEVQFRNAYYRTNLSTNEEQVIFPFWSSLFLLTWPTRDFVLSRWLRLLIGNFGSAGRGTTKRRNGNFIRVRGSNISCHSPGHECVWYHSFKKCGWQFQFLGYYGIHERYGKYRWRRVSLSFHLYRWILYPFPFSS